LIFVNVEFAIPENTILGKPPRGHPEPDVSWTGIRLSGYCDSRSVRLGADPFASCNVYRAAWAFLERRFGADYVGYKEKVRRWI
jgi:hypothetical protein